MTALSLTYVLSNGALADATQVEQDLTDIANYINASVIRTDGVNPMVGDLSLAANPSADAHAVRKAYMDGPFLAAHGAVAQTFTANVYTTVKFSAKDRDTATAYSTTTGLFTAPTTGVYLVSFTIAPPSTDNEIIRMAVAAGGTSYDGPRYVPSAINAVAESANQTQAIPVYVTATQTIAPQVSLSGGATRSFGANLSIAWLHG